MKRNHVFSVCFIPLLVFASITSGGELRVGAGEAYSTIQSAIDLAVDGDVVIVGDGTWTPGVLTIEGKGITLRSGGGAGDCVLLKTRVNVRNVVAGEVRIEGFTFRLKNRFVDAVQVNRLILKDCVMERTVRALTAVGSTCELYHCRVDRAGVYYNGSNWVIAQHETPTISIDDSPGDVIFEGCMISEVYGIGVESDAPNSVFRNCIIMGCSYWGIKTPNPVQLTNCTIINNNYGLSTKNDLAVIENCIFRDNTRDIVSYNWGANLDRPESITVKNSYIMHGWPGENVYRGDPKITREGYLMAGSPCIDSGGITDNSATDVDGEIRVQGGAIDIGADEFSDQDTDGLPDAWEERYFGSATSVAADDDEDEDGLANIEEFQHGSFPHSTYWYVDDDQADDSGDGRSWATAKKTISAATILASAGDIVIVGDGEYSGYELFWGEPVWIRSANGSGNCLINTRVYLDYFEGEDFILDGFYINGSKPDQLPSIYIGREQGTPTIQNCIITGGLNGILIESGGVIVKNCRIHGNTKNGIEMSGRDYEREYLSRMLRVEGCDIFENGEHGILACDREGVFPLVKIHDSNIHHNDFAGVWSWAIFDVNRCRFEGNGWCGFGISSPDMVIRNCVITGNCWGSRHLPGLGVSSVTFPPVKRLLIENCTIAHNLGDGGIGGFSQGAEPFDRLVKNCIVWGNRIDESETGQIYIQPDVGYVVENSNIEGGWEGEGNIDEEPFFADPSAMPYSSQTVWVEGDYRLSSLSPCINAGDADYAADENETDLDGMRRVLGGRIDMGAYENSSADFLRDQSIDVGDLMLFASRWLDQGCEEPGWCGGADLTLDGVVDGGDLAKLASEWSFDTGGPLSWLRFDESSGEVEALADMD